MPCINLIVSIDSRAIILDHMTISQYIIPMTPYNIAPNFSRISYISTIYTLVCVSMEQAGDSVLLQGIDLPNHATAEDIATRTRLIENDIKVTINPNM